MPNHHIDFRFTPITESDTALLFRWLREPHVNIWWPVLAANESLDAFLERIRSKDTRGFIVHYTGIPIGYIQHYPIDRSGEKSGKYLPELPETTVGTDQFIGDPAYIGKGYGTLFINAFIEYLRHLEPTITTIIVDPDPTNAAAIKCYEKVGFKRMGTYTTPEYTFLLMRYDLLS